MFFFIIENRKDIFLFNLFHLFIYEKSLYEIDKNIYMKYIIYIKDLYQLYHEIKKILQLLIVSQSRGLSSLLI